MQNNLIVLLEQELDIINKNILILEKEIENIIIKLDTTEDLWDAWRV